MSERSQVLGQEGVRDAAPAYRMNTPQIAQDDVPPGYKRTEVGVIPDDWTVEKIGNLRPFVTSGSRGWARFYSDTGATFLRITNLTRQSIHLDLGELKFVALPFENFAEANRTGVKDGDLLISITADIGIIGYVDTSVPKPAFLNQHLALVRFDPEEVSSKYTAYYLASERPQRLFLASMDVGAKAGINLITIRKLQLALPPLREQRAIATALSDADALIESFDLLIAKKRAIKQAAMQQLLTGQTRLPGFTGEWETKRLGEFVSIRNQKVMPSSVHPDTLCIELEHLGQGDGRLWSQSTAKHSTASKYRFQAGDVLFGRLRSYLRKYWLAEQDGICTTEIWPLSVDADKAVSGFLMGIVQSDRFNETASISYGTHMPRADWKVLKNFEVRLPEVEEQTAIATVLSDMDAEIEALEHRRDKARQIKQGMMQQLLTGRARLVEETREGASYG